MATENSPPKAEDNVIGLIGTCEYCGKRVIGKLWKPPEEKGVVLLLKNEEAVGVMHPACVDYVNRIVST